jgi:cytochrome c553
MRRYCAKSLAGLSIFIGGIATSMAAQPVKGDPAKALPIIEQSCAACHGMDGNSPVPNFPKLAGQHFEYLLHELQEYKSEHRVNELMAPLVKDLSKEDMINIAAYFAAQSPAPGVVTEPGLLALGKKIYMEGNPANGLPSCEGCHEENGAGSPRYPRVAGQNVEYTLEQFRLSAAGTRKFSKKVMRVVAERTTEQEIRAVAEYMASMP